MQVVRTALLVLGLGSLALLCGCARKTDAKRHTAAQGETATTLVPTPDNTPIEALRTPAGLVLKTGPEPNGTPAPERTSSPSASTKASP